MKNIHSDGLEMMRNIKRIIRDSIYPFFLLCLKVVEPKPKSINRFILLIVLKFMVLGCIRLDNYLIKSLIFFIHVLIDGQN